MLTTHPDMIARIVALTIEMVTFRSFGVIDSLHDDQGAFWSDEQLNGGDLVAYYHDLVEHEESFPIPVGFDENGEPIIEEMMMPVRTLDQLRIIAPHHAEALDREFNRELEKMKRNHRGRRAS